MDVSLTDLGAVPGQEIGLLLQTAVNTVGLAGGGRVLIPSGYWQIDGTRFIWIKYDNVQIEGVGGTVVEIVNWQPYIPEVDGTANNHATFLVGSVDADVSNFGMRRIRFISEWDVDTHAPFGIQGDAKGLLFIGHPLQTTTRVYNTIVEDIRTDRCGSYLVAVSGRIDGLIIRRCSVNDQYFSGFACVGAQLLQTPLITDCSASKIKGHGVQWTGHAHIERFRAYDCRSSGIFMINADDASPWTLIDGGRIDRCGNYPSTLIAGASVIVGGEIYGGRQVIVRGVTMTDSYGSGVCWGGGQVKNIIVEDCIIHGLGLGCGTDEPSRAGFGKESGIQPIAGISLGGYRILVRRNSILGDHTGFTAGEVAVRNGIWLGATESNGETFRADMVGWPDCAYGDSIGGTYGDSRVSLPSNASDS